MSTRTLPKASSTAAENKPVSPTPDDVHNAKVITLIDKSLPIRFGFRRRVLHLWDNRYRVNFHVASGNYHIVDSYHVVVLDDKAIIEG
jgi:hypothetical protein